MYYAYFNYTLNKIDGTVNNGQSRDTGNIGSTKHRRKTKTTNIQKKQKQKQKTKIKTKTATTTTQKAKKMSNTDFTIKTGDETHGDLFM